MNQTQFEGMCFDVPASKDAEVCNRNETSCGNSSTVCNVAIRPHGEKEIIIPKPFDKNLFLIFLICLLTLSMIANFILFFQNRGQEFLIRELTIRNRQTLFEN